MEKGMGDQLGAGCPQSVWRTRTSKELISASHLQHVYLTVHRPQPRGTQHWPARLGCCCQPAPGAPRLPAAPDHPLPCATSDALSTAWRHSYTAFLNTDLFTVSLLVLPSTCTDTPAAGAPRFVVYPQSSRQRNRTQSRNKTRRV